MRLYWILVLTMLLCFGCGKSEKQAINKATMVKILVDVHLAESALQEMNIVQKDSIGKSYYRKIFQLHKVSEDDFNRTLLWYRKEPDEMESLYKDVIKELEVQEKAAQ